MFFVLQGCTHLLPDDPPMCMTVQCAPLYQPRGFLETACRFEVEPVRLFLGLRVFHGGTMLQMYHHKHHLGVPRG